MHERDPYSPGPWGAQHVHTPDQQEAWDLQDERTPIDLGKVPVTITLPAKDMQDFLSAYCECDGLDPDRQRLLTQNVRAQIDATLRVWRANGVPAALDLGGAA